jgi:hypothetical protein
MSSHIFPMPFPQIFLPLSFILPKNVLPSNTFYLQFVNACLIISIAKHNFSVGRPVNQNKTFFHPHPLLLPSILNNLLLVGHKATNF